MATMMTSFLSFVYYYFRPVVKWFLRKTTKLCELQRICYGEELGFPRTSKVEYSLTYSRTKPIIELVKKLNTVSTEGGFHGKASGNCAEYAVTLVMKIKNIKPAIHRQFILSFHSCLYQIYGYKQLYHDVEVLRKTPYSSENSSHEAKLLELWSLLKPDQALQNRISKQWTDIGFQGDDPKTDFRGMGILGLENLLYFAKEYGNAARHVLLHSCHPQYGYSFAIVGINLTSMALELLKSGFLKVHLFNAVKGQAYIHHFHHVYCYLFYEFDKFWLSAKPRDIMEFNHIRNKFELELLKKFENPKTTLKLNFAIDIL